MVSSYWMEHTTVSLLVANESWPSEVDAREEQRDIKLRSRVSVRRVCFFSVHFVVVVRTQAIESAPWFNHPFPNLPPAMRSWQVPSYQSDVDYCKSLNSQLRGASLCERVGNQIYGLYQRHEMTSEQTKQHDAIIQSLNSRIERKWPGHGLKLVPFGSTTTGLGTCSSDLDLVLTDPARPKGRWTQKEDYVQAAKGLRHGIFYDGGDLLPVWYDVTVLSVVLSESKFVERSEAIPSAVVPLVRLTIKGGRDRVDVVVNNIFSEYTSALIAAYVSLRPKTLPVLYFGIKYWMRNRGLNNSSVQPEGHLRTMSSYAIAILVIQYLQERHCLPNLQALSVHLPESQQERLPDGYEKRVAKAEDWHSASNVKYHRVSFADPFYSHSRYFKIIDCGRVRVIVPPGFFATHKCPPSLEMWMIRYDVLHEQPQWQDLDDPQLAGLHYVEEGTIEEINTHFVGFFNWLDCNILSGRTAVSISYGYPLPLDEPLTPAVLAKGRGTCICCDRKVYGTGQPTAWHTRDFVVCDPFIRIRNVATSMQGQSLFLLREEVRRAQALLGASGDHLDFMDLAALPGIRRQNQNDGDADGVGIIASLFSAAVL